MEFLCCIFGKPYVVLNQFPLLLRHHPRSSSGGHPFTADYLLPPIPVFLVLLLPISVPPLKTPPALFHCLDACHIWRAGSIWGFHSSDVSAVLVHPPDAGKML